MPEPTPRIVEYANPFRSTILWRCLLRMDQKDADVLKVLIKGEDYETFMKAFLNRVLDINKSNPMQRATVMAGMLSVKREFQRQKVAGDVDYFTILRSVFEKLTEHKLNIPLNLQLMIRNIETFMRLTEQQGLDFGNYFAS